MHKKSSRRLKYSPEQKQLASNYYYEHGRFLARTACKLGFPSRTVLGEWLREIHPEDFPYCTQSTIFSKINKNPKRASCIGFMLTSEKPNEKWLTEITEFHIPDGKVYLSPVIDYFNDLPVAWTIGTSPNAELVNTMLDTAITTLKNGERPIVHSDRGAHYRWPGWIERMENSGLLMIFTRFTMCYTLFRIFNLIFRRSSHAIYYNQ